MVDKPCTQEKGGEERKGRGLRGREGVEEKGGRGRGKEWEGVPYDVWFSNGNDIETKRNHTSIIGVFSVSKRKEPTYCRTWKDRSEANILLLFFAGSKK